MGILTSLARRPRFEATAGQFPPAWYADLASRSQSGVRVNATTALQTSVVWGCADIIANTMSILPIKIYQRGQDGGRSEARQHPLWDLFQIAPNTEQPVSLFKHTMMLWALLWGNAYARILPGARGAIDQLVPLHPERVRTERMIGPTIDGFQTYRTRYWVQDESGAEQATNDEDIFHLPGLSTDGTNGLSLIDFARESIGLAIAPKSYSARFYSNGARPDGILSYPGTLTKESREAMLAAWHDSHGGAANAHKVAAMPDSIKWLPTGMTNEDAQLIEQLNWSVEDVARFFHMPLHMVQHMTKSTSWGSGIEEMWDEFLTVALLPWVIRWENAIDRDLIMVPQLYYAKGNVNALQRIKFAERVAGYATAIQNGWMSINDVLGLEDQNPIGALGDVRYRMSNLVPLDSPGPVPTVPAPVGARDSGHYHLLLHEAAERIIRKEATVLSKVARKHAYHPAGWEAELAEFCGEHRDYVAQTLCCGTEAAERYVNELQDALLAHGVAVLEDEQARVAKLVALALGGGFGG